MWINDGGGIFSMEKINISNRGKPSIVVSFFAKTFRQYGLPVNRNKVFRSKIKTRGRSKCRHNLHSFFNFLST